MHIINTGVYRPNLSHRVIPTGSDAEKQQELLTLARDQNGPAIIYAATVRHVDELRVVFQQESLTAVSYHGRMRANERADAEDAFMNEDGGLIVASNAIGMGIDRPDIRAVIHYDLPASLEVYYQESGRAGAANLRCADRRDAGPSSPAVSGSPCPVERSA